MDLGRKPTNDFREPYNENRQTKLLTLKHKNDRRQECALPTRVLMLTVPVLTHHQSTSPGRTQKDHIQEDSPGQKRIQMSGQKCSVNWLN